MFGMLRYFFLQTLICFFNIVPKKVKKRKNYSRCLNEPFFFGSRQKVASEYSLMHKKIDKNIFKNCIGEKFRKQLNFFTCISPDYVFHESPKEFWKYNNFENMGASFLRRCQNSLWQTSHEMMYFQA